MTDIYNSEDPSLAAGQSGRSPAFERQKYTSGGGGNRGRRKPRRVVEADPMPPSTSIHDDYVTNAMRKPVRQRDGTILTLMDFILNNLGAEAVGGRKRSGEDDHLPKINVAAAKLVIEEHRLASRFEAALIQWIIRRKTALADEFTRRRRRRSPLPEIVPHPDHVLIGPDGMPRIVGPMTREQQMAWELLKYHIRATADHHARLRRELLKQPADAALLNELRDTEKHRRALMRKVPKGWNWREKVITCDSSAEAMISNVEVVMNVMIPQEHRRDIADIYRPHCLL